MKNIKSWITRIILLSCACLVLTVANAQAATWTVTKIQDTDDGVCDADCSLREAIGAAAAGDSVVFSSLFNTPPTITLQSYQVYPNGLLIVPGLTIAGPGADLLTVMGNYAPVFTTIAVAGSVNLSGMTIANGEGIVNAGTTTISECVITGTSQAIDNLATMTIVNSTIMENSGLYGAVQNLGEMTLLNSTISENSSNGLWNIGTLTVTNSTISGSNGVGLLNSGTATILNSTISGNGSTGVTLSVGTVTISSSTITDNGHGVSSSVLGTLRIRNTIIAVNGPYNDDINAPGATVISGGYNLIGNDGTGVFTNTGDQTGTFAAPLDPLLDPLGDYGGMTATHRLQANSPAIDKGNRFGLTEDQREFLRPYDKPNTPNAPGGDGSDIGSYELQFAVALAGNVFDPNGNPLKNTRVLIRSANGERRSVKTNRFGMYRFDNVARNRTYQISPMHGRYQFTPRMVMVMEANISNLNFMALP